jgi:transcription elongation factor
MPYAEPTLVVASAARTTNGNSGVITPSGDGETICFNVRVTATSGTPNLALSVEWSNDATNFATNDGTADTFTAITTTAEKVKTFERKAKFYRLVWVITGTTPSLTFQIYEYMTA